MVENEVIELDFDEILTLIQGQLLEYMNAPGNYEKYRSYNIVLSKEQQFMKLKDKDPNTLYIVVKFGSADVVFGQTVLPATITALTEQNRLDAAYSLLYEYAQKYNLVRVNNNTINQVYESPTISSNFNPVYEGFRSAVTMTAAFVVGKNSNEYKVYYYYTERQFDGTEDYVDENGEQKKRNKYKDVTYADEVPQISASFAFVGSPDTQAFYNSHDFTRSEIGFGAVTVGFTTLMLSDNRLINDILDILGLVSPAKKDEVCVLGDYTSKYVMEQPGAEPLTDSSIKEKLEGLTDANGDRVYPEDMWNNLSVIGEEDCTLWRYQGKKWGMEDQLEKTTSVSYNSDIDGKVNKTFKLGTVFRDSKHARIKDYKLSDAISAQEIGQIPAISLSFVE